jgi:hypothetical protein
MKTKQFFLLLYCLLAISCLWSQTKNTPIPDDTLKNSIINVKPICNGVSGYSRFNGQNNTCIGGQTKLYYSISYSTSFQFGVDIDIKFNMLDYTGTISMNASYKIYGPFNQNDDYVSMIGLNIAPVVETGISNTGWHAFNSSVIANKLYIVEIITNSCEGMIDWQTNFLTNQLFECSYSTICESCLPKFQPIGRKVFVVSAWVKEEVASANGEINYTASVLRVTSGTNTRVLTPKGQIIDGWQRIEDTITTNTIGNLKIECMVSSGTSYFDDIRVFPYDGTMITYVYDPVTLRLAAELDERNYAKIYEYDEEGKLVRIKQETEKGIMTIQENRENSSTTVPGY